jgi:hypothetical protein
MSQLEAFATFRSPSTQIYNLSALGTTPTSLLFDTNPGTRAATGLGTTTITCANTFDIEVGMQVVSVTTLVIPAGTYVVAVNPGVSIVVNRVIAASAAGTIRFLNNNHLTIARLRISNLSTVNAVAIQFSDITQTALPTVDGNTAGFTAPAATSPTFTASTFACSSSTALAIGDGIRIQPASTLEINVGLSTRLWIVASAASTPVQVAAILQNG